jgi:hypothetical protein
MPLKAVCPNINTEDMKLIKYCVFTLVIATVCHISVFAEPIFYVNQVAYDARLPKIAVLGLDAPLTGKHQFNVVDARTLKIVDTYNLGNAQQVIQWDAQKVFYQADFSAFMVPGHYKLEVSIQGKKYFSYPFLVGDNVLAGQTIPAILHYFRKQRANTATEWANDQHIQLFGSDKKVDLRGGWCDASGDVSKYFSHLAYANFMSPQQIPLVTWSLINTAERVPKLIKKLNLQDSIRDEALWGADYLMRSLSDQDYFYMTVFTYFKKDPDARRVVGLRANSVTTNEYQCAFREGGGMAIAALARVSQWKKDGDFTSQQYLEGAERAFAHLLINNTKYDDDGKENIIDDYCALMAATELWIATDGALYRDEARKRAKKLTARQTLLGYFVADDGQRPFWHAADAGLPIVSLSRYVEKEQDASLRKDALDGIAKNLAYNIRVTAEVLNPFGYARQTFNYEGKIKNGFFIPHQNETGWWWQGENARLASMATAAITAGSLDPVQKTGDMAFASRQLNWILGENPFSVCFMYQFGQNNVPYMHSNYGHGSEKGGISNGITGKDGHGDGSGIDFKRKANGDEWRWTEQWLPHAAWFLQAVTALVSEN